MNSIQILYPMFGMILLSGIISLTLLATRLPIVIKGFGKLQAGKHSDELRPHLPDRMRYITDNYNHLFEQPTLFYALIVYIYLVQHVDATQVKIAWLYLILRIAHSLIQITSNNVSARALVFIASSLCLMVMITREIVFLL